MQDEEKSLLSNIQNKEENCCLIFNRLTEENENVVNWIYASPFIISLLHFNRLTEGEEAMLFDLKPKIHQKHIFISLGHQ